MHIEGADKCRTLSAVVVQAKQLEAGIVFGTQVTLYLVFITERLQTTAGHQELLGHRCHTVITQQVTEYLKVLWFVDTRILTHFLKVWEGTPLSLFMRDDGRLVWHTVLIVTRILDTTVVIVITPRRMTIPIQSTSTTLDMIL